MLSTSNSLTPSTALTVSSSESICPSLSSNTNSAFKHSNPKANGSFACRFKLIPSFSDVSLHFLLIYLNPLPFLLEEFLLSIQCLSFCLRSLEITRRTSIISCGFSATFTSPNKIYSAIWTIEFYTFIVGHNCSITTTACW